MRLFVSCRPPGAWDGWNEEPIGWAVDLWEPSFQSLCTAATGYGGSKCPKKIPKTRRLITTWPLCGLPQTIPKVIKGLKMHIYPRDWDYQATLTPSSYSKFSDMNRGLLASPHLRLQASTGDDADKSGGVPVGSRSCCPVLSFLAGGVGVKMLAVAKLDQQVFQDCRGSGKKREQSSQMTHPFPITQKRRLTGSLGSSAIREQPSCSFPSRGLVCLSVLWISLGGQGQGFAQVSGIC